MGESPSPFAGVHSVPAFRQVTVLPSPMSHTTFDTRAVAVTVTPPALADLVIGPQPRSSALSTQSQVGSPITETASDEGRGVAPTRGERRFIASTASRASAEGLTATGAVSDQK